MSWFTIVWTTIKGWLALDRWFAGRKDKKIGRLEERLRQDQETREANEKLASDIRNTDPDKWVSDDEAFGSDD